MSAGQPPEAEVSQGPGTGHPPRLGLLPLAPREGAIGGAPPALLQTGEASHRTFLARATGLLRKAGVERLVALVPDTAGPLAVAARREGAELLAVSGRPTREEVLATGLTHLARQGKEAWVVVFPPVLATVAPDTLVRFLAGGEAAEEVAETAEAAAGDAPGAPVAELHLSPRSRGWVATADEVAHPGAPSALDGPRLLLLHQVPDTPIPALADFRALPVGDPGVIRPIDTLTLYRRHFPQAARGRFHKW